MSTDCCVTGYPHFSSVPGVDIIGTPAEKAAVLSFVIGNIDSADIGTMLDLWGIAVRTGHHCAQPVMARFWTVRSNPRFIRLLQHPDRHRCPG
jgi:selenocysteine lyase/cysteine desulfurase